MVWLISDTGSLFQGSTFPRVPSSHSAQPPGVCVFVVLSRSVPGAYTYKEPSSERPNSLKSFITGSNVPWAQSPQRVPEPFGSQRECSSIPLVLRSYFFGVPCAQRLMWPRCTICVPKWPKIPKTLSSQDPCFFGNYISRITCCQCSVFPHTSCPRVLHSTVVLIYQSRLFPETYSISQRCTHTKH